MDFGFIRTLTKTNMIILPIIAGLFNKKPISSSFLQYLNGDWTGYIAKSDNISSSSQKFENATLNFALDETKEFSTLTVSTSSSSSIFKKYFIKRLPDSNDTLLVMTNDGIDVINFTIYNGIDINYYVGRGLSLPKNDQFSLSVEEIKLDFVITDQFTNNVTIARFVQGKSVNIYKILLYIGVSLTLLALFCAAIYKASDLSEVVTPEEGENALRTKAESIRNSQIKKAKKKSDKKVKTQ